MADTKFSALTGVSSVAGTNEFGLNEAGTSKKASASQIATYVNGLVPEILLANTTTQQTGFATDQYLTGSMITADAAGAWKAGGHYHCEFNMAKTAAGTAAPVIIVRMGTAGTTADAAVLTLTFAGAQTAVVDNAIIDVDLIIVSVGGGTSAVIFGAVIIKHKGNAVGLTNQGGNTFYTFFANSAGFDSSAATKLGLSFNGGASFAGTCDYVFTRLLQ